MRWGIGQEEAEDKFHAGRSWKRSRAHDFILKWQEKQNALKQGFQPQLKRVQGELLKYSKHCQLACTYANELQMPGPKFEVMCARTEGQRGHASISRLQILETDFYMVSVPETIISHFEF